MEADASLGLVAPSHRQINNGTGDAADGETGKEIELPAFVHERLTDETNEIRLLQMLPRSEDGAIIDLQFAICVRSWSEVPAYNAISYVWGDTKVRRGITIDGKRCSIHRNCYDALKQVFDQWTCGNTTTSYVWVDSVCIDQGHLREKSHQVANMGVVYEKASVVYSCIGPHSDDSEVLLQKAPEPEQMKCTCASRCPHLRYCTPKLQLWASSVGYDKWLRYWQAYQAFTQRAYWSRLWVVQEVVKSKGPVILCGMSPLSWEKLQWLDVLPGYCYQHGTRSMVPQIPVSIHNTLSNSPIRLLSYVMRHEIELSTWLWKYATFACFDRRDRLYGLLGLIRWPQDMEPIFPDYGLSTLDLVVLLVPYMKFSDISRLLASFELTSKDRNVKDLIYGRSDRRTSKSAQQNEAQDQKPATPCCIHRKSSANCFVIGEGRDGNLIVGHNPPSYTPDQIYRTLSNRFRRKRPCDSPKKLFKNGAEIGMLCGAAAKGDLLCEMLQENSPSGIRYPKVSLVLRQSQGLRFNIIGQAIHKDEVPGQLFHPRDSVADIAVEMTIEDWVTFFIQDMVQWDSGHTGIYEQARHERLFTPVTGAVTLESTTEALKTQYMSISSYHKLQKFTKLSLAQIRRRFNQVRAHKDGRDF